MADTEAVSDRSNPALGTIGGLLERATSDGAGNNAMRAVVALLGRG